MRAPSDPGTPKTDSARTKWPAHAKAEKPKVVSKGEAPLIGDRIKLLSGLIGQHIRFRIGVLLHGFVVALLAIRIIGSRRLIAALTRMIVVLCNCTPALLHCFF